MNCSMPELMPETKDQIWTDIIIQTILDKSHNHVLCKVDRMLGGLSSVAKQRKAARPPPSKPADVRINMKPEALNVNCNNWRHEHLPFKLYECCCQILQVV